MRACRITASWRQRRATPTSSLAPSTAAARSRKGKHADLLLLNANPLEDISATTRRSGVMLKGKWYEQRDLDWWLDEIAVRFHATAPVHDDPAAADRAAAAEVPQKLFAAMKTKGCRQQ